ncbi:MAG: hypothetical protein U0L18_04305, partial [Acutalibacteraceae bacterium]|nr:hypothetical protein [Acutalibacteraceae bacterium]
MKKLISILLTITMLLGITAIVPLSASAATTNKVESGFAYADNYGTWIYEVINDGKECRIIQYQGTKNELEIPDKIPYKISDKITDLPVVEIGDLACNGGIFNHLFYTTNN